eukprot:1158640-Pelagomonas_calceolata.AAC.3
MCAVQPELELAPGFKAPAPTSYDDLRAYIDTNLPAESPAIYGACSTNAVRLQVVCCLLTWSGAEPKKASQPSAVACWVRTSCPSLLGFSHHSCCKQSYVRFLQYAPSRWVKIISSVEPASHPFHAKTGQKLFSVEPASHPSML